jgi:hypothetical protein
MLRDKSFRLHDPAVYQAMGIPQPGVRTGVKLGPGRYGREENSQ